MSEEVLADDQSHYEVSLTAGQAFLAFVLLLLSLAAAFAFGLLLGRGQLDDRFAGKKLDGSPVVTEASTPVKPAAREVVTKDDDFKEPVAAPRDKTAPPVVLEEKNAEPPAAAPVQTKAAVAAKPIAPQARATEPPVSRSDPAFAQLLSTSDQKTAESLAAKLIDGGFNSAYVERTTTPKGTVYRVRIRFGSEDLAKAAKPKLKSFSKDVWITKS